MFDPTSRGGQSRPFLRRQSPEAVILRLLATPALQRLPYSVVARAHGVFRAGAILEHGAIWGAVVLISE